MKLKNYRLATKIVIIDSSKDHQWALKLVGEYYMAMTLTNKTKILKMSVRMSIPPAHSLSLTAYIPHLESRQLLLPSFPHVPLLNLRCFQQLI